MPLYQINYDLRSKSPDHGVVDKKIQQLFPGAVRALESTWLADHGGTPLDVANIMRLQVLDQDDGLIVTEANGGVGWNIAPTAPNALGATPNALALPMPLQLNRLSILGALFAERVNSAMRR